MRIIVDIDSVTADLLPVWLARYNRDYKDDLMEHKLLSWSIHLYVKPECGMNIYVYLRDRNLYRDVKPVEDALYYVNKLRKDGHEIIFATSSPYQAMGEKFAWLNGNGFEVDEEHYVEGPKLSRSLIRGDLLLDDNLESCRKFDVATLAFRSVVFDKPWNQGDHPYRVKSWADFYKLVKENDNES